MIFFPFLVYIIQLLDSNNNNNNNYKKHKIEKGIVSRGINFAIEPISIIFEEFNFAIWGKNHEKYSAKICYA